MTALQPPGDTSGPALTNGNEERTFAALLRLFDYANGHSTKELLQRFLDETEALTDSRIGFYHFVEEDQVTLSLQTWSTNTQKFCTAPGAGTHYPIRQAGVWVDCVRQGKPVVHNDYASLPHRKGCPEGHVPLLRELVVPVIRSGKLVAILGVGNKPSDYSERDVHVVGELAELAWETVVRKREEAERQKLQEQLVQMRKLDAVGQLAGGVAHDFNNLLMAIMGYVELCRDEVAPDSPARGWLSEISTVTLRSADLVRQLLGFARRQMVVPRVLDLNDTVGNMLKLVGRLIGEDIDLQWRPAEGLWPTNLDPSQVNQILVNLCVNSRDAIHGAGKIVIETANAVLDEDYCAGHAECAPGDFVLLTVSDNGCGIAKETLDKIFEPFFTTKEHGQGTGLGLATVYGIVKQNEGHITVYSEPGKGSTFRVYLPRHTDGAAEPAAAETSALPPVSGEGVLLLVEDDASIRATTKVFLEKLGYTVWDAHSPDEALRLAAASEQPIRLLITDVVLPGMNGRELAEHLTRQRPSMRCLFMSGYTATVIANRGLISSDVNFLAKPVTRDQLARKVAEVLGAEAPGA